jgi:iron complex outermembrane receptor protein
VVLKRNLLSVALASATWMMAPGAYAQTATPDVETAASEDVAPEGAESEATTLDRVTVTGIRRSIEQSIETKQASTSIVEAISAEDIGKLPDTSIADSLARLPGLTAQRFGNRPQEINIRGFAGDFSTALLNGREQVSLGNSRGVEFDQYPSELIHQVVVYKTPDAELVGQGLSGTVDLRTVRPLEYGERAVAVNVRGDMSKIGDEKEYGNRFSLSYIDQFADDTVGLALGYARLNNPGQGHQFEAWGYPDGVLGGGKLYDIQNDNERNGFMGVLEFKPSDIYSTTLDVFYSKFDKEERKRGMEFGLAWGSPGTPLTRTSNANGTAVSTTWENFDPVIRNDYNATLDDLFAIGSQHELKLSEAWTLRADISHSSAKRNERILETYAGLADSVGTDTVAVTLNPNGYYDFDFGFDYGDPSILRLTDAGGWGQDGYLKDFEVRDELTSLRLDLERSFDTGAISSIEFGANLTDRTKSRASEEAFLCLNACRDDAQAPIPTQFLTGTSFGFAGLPSIYGYDALSALSLYNLRSNSHPDISNKNWEVNEEVVTAYVQANIDTNLGTIPVRGNVGVQAVSVDQSSTGVATFEGVALSEAATRGASYTHYLPSLNLSFELPAAQFVRFGAARQMARPRMDDLRANTGFGIDRTRQIWTGGGGNPELEPWLANAFDLSYEKYFGNRGYVSAAYFFKDLKTYIYNQTVPFDFSQLPVPPSILPGDLPPSDIGEFNQPVNGEGGFVRGHELAVSLPLEMLWAPLEGFGVQVNYSDTDSSIQSNGPGSNEPLPGLSKYVTNGTVFYERFGFSARVSARHRSAFVGEVQGFGGDRTRIPITAETVTDLQLGYTFQGGPLKDLSLLLQVNNLENEPFRSTFDGMEDRPKQYFEYGRTYLLGVNYRF